MISYIDIEGRKIAFKTSVLAIRDFAYKKNMKFEQAFELIAKSEFEDIVSLWHSSIHTITGQEDVTEDQLWQWIDSEPEYMNKFMDAMVETMAKNLFSPVKNGQR